MKLLFPLILLFSLPAFSNPLEKLKKTPATKFEMAKGYLDISAQIINSQIKGKRVQGTNFYVEKFVVHDFDGKLKLIGKFTGPTREILRVECIVIKERFESPELKNLPQTLWPSLNEHEQEKLKKYVYFSVEIISKDNGNFSFSC